MLAQMTCGCRITIDNVMKDGRRQPKEWLMTLQNVPVNDCWISHCGIMKTKWENNDRNRQQQQNTFSSVTAGCHTLGWHNKKMGGDIVLRSW